MKKRFRCGYCDAKGEGNLFIIKAIRERMPERVNEAGGDRQGLETTASEDRSSGGMSR